MNAPFARGQASIAVQHLCSGDATPCFAWLYSPHTPVNELNTVCAPVRYVGQVVLKLRIR